MDYSQKNTESLCRTPETKYCKSNMLQFFLSKIINIYTHKRQHRLNWKHIISWKTPCPCFPLWAMNCFRPGPAFTTQGTSPLVSDLVSFNSWVLYSLKSNHNLYLKVLKVMLHTCTFQLILSDNCYLLRWS